MIRSAPLSKRLLYSLLALMMMLWAGNFVIGKIVLREIPPLLAASLRLALAGALILPVYAWDGRRKLHRWSWADVPRLLAIGVICIAGNQVLFLVGLERTTATHAALMFGLSPIQVLLIAAAIRQETITARKLTGMVIAFSGVMILQSSGAEGAGGATLLGDLLVFAGVFAFSLFTVFGKQSTATHGAITMNTFAYVGGGLLLTPVIIGLGSGFAFSSVSATGWLGLFYMALFPSVVCYIIFYYALTYVEASRLAALAYLQPLLAMLLAIPILGENVTYSLVIGGAMVLSGVYVTERG